MAKIQVSTKINNENVDYLCEPHDTMLDVLRNQLNLTGSKESCGSGDCGSCSCLLYTSPSPRDSRKSRMPSSA